MYMDIYCNSICHSKNWKCMKYPAVCVHVVSRVRLFATPWTVAYQAPLSMGFSRQEYWTGLPFPSPGDVPDPGIKPESLHLLYWQVNSLPLHHLRSFIHQYSTGLNCVSVGRTITQLLEKNEWEHANPECARYMYIYVYIINNKYPFICIYIYIKVKILNNL